MRWSERTLEQRLADAAANGELAAPTLEGRPIADLHHERPQGWWTKQFVERELSYDRCIVAQQAAAAARVGFWQCHDEAAVRLAVDAANAAIAGANVNMVAGDRLPPFDPDDVVDRWLRLRR